MNGYPSSCGCALSAPTPCASITACNLEPFNRLSCNDLGARQRQQGVPGPAAAAAGAAGAADVLLFAPHIQHVGAKQREQGVQRSHKTGEF